MEILNYGIILALIPIVFGLVQSLKRESWSSWLVRSFTVLVGLAVTFIVRQAEIPEVSASLGNYWLTGLTGVAAALASMGLYGQAKSDIVNKIAKSTSDVTVPSELVDVKKEDEASTKKK